MILWAPDFGRWISTIISELIPISVQLTSALLAIQSRPVAPRPNQAVTIVHTVMVVVRVAAAVLRSVVFHHAAVPLPAVADPLVVVGRLAAGGLPAEEPLVVVEVVEELVSRNSGLTIFKEIIYDDKNATNRRRSYTISSQFWT